MTIQKQNTKHTIQEKRTQKNRTQKKLTKTVLFALSSVLVSIATPLSAAEYKHGDWPVVLDTNGLWSFKSNAQEMATPLCTAYYTADVKSQDEFGTGKSIFGTLIREHSVSMRAAYAKVYSGSSLDLDKKVEDMRWHFANSAQYGAFQEFKDSANMACERHALAKGVISQDYLDAFNSQMTDALAGL